MVTAELQHEKCEPGDKDEPGKVCLPVCVRRCQHISIGIGTFFIIFHECFAPYHSPM